MSDRGAIRIGIGGWSYDPWRGAFYPDDLPRARELEFAARALTAIEINSTFYRSQSETTFAKWRDATPEGFVFALKAPRYTTSRKALAEAGDSVARFAESLAPLGARLGPVNWQFPPAKRFDAEDFAAFLALLPPKAGDLPLRHAVELRHESFRDAGPVRLARARNVAIVQALDSPHPEIADPTADFAYLRLMGTTEGPALGYSAPALDAHADRLRALAKGEAPRGGTLLTDPVPPRPREVFCFVIGGRKVSNPAAAQALIERVGRP